MWFKTDVSGLYVVPIFKGQASILKMVPIGSPKTSILNDLNPHNSPEDGRTEPKFVYWVSRPQSPQLIRAHACIK
jgi:hypothetical protein